MQRPDLARARDELIAAAEADGQEIAFGRSTREAVEALVPFAGSVSAEVLEFWTEATPIQVEVPFPPERLHLFALEEVPDPRSGVLGPDWRESWIVLGDIAGDPVIADTSRAETPVMVALHGVGAWSPITIAPGIASFLRAVAAYLDVLVRYGGERVDEDRDFEVKPGFDRDLTAEWKPLIGGACTDALLRYINT